MEKARSHIVAQSLGYRLESIREENRNVIEPVFELIGLAAFYDRAHSQRALDHGTIFDIHSRFFANPKDLSNNGMRKFSVTGGWIADEDLLISTRSFETKLIAPKIKIRKSLSNNDPEVVIAHNHINGNPFESVIFPSVNRIVLKPSCDIMTDTYKRSEVRALTADECTTLRVLMEHLRDKMLLFSDHENPPPTHPLLQIGRSVKNIKDYHTQIQELIA